MVLFNPDKWLTPDHLTKHLQGLAPLSAIFFRKIHLEYRNKYRETDFRITLSAEILGSERGGGDCIVF